MMVNDHWVDDNTPVFPVTDRSFRFGDGVFETIIVCHGQLFDFAAHKKRLQDVLSYIRLSVPLDTLETKAQAVIKRNQLDQGYIRIIISRGSQEKVIGYAPSGKSIPVVVVQPVARSWPSSWANGAPQTLHPSSYPVFYHTPGKTNNALVYTLALMEAAENNHPNAILFDKDGYLCETATGNLFWRKGETLFTPSSSLPFVPGTIRALMVKLWSGDIQECRAKPEDLNDAEALFYTNVGGLITPVSGIPALNLHFRCPDPAIESLRDRLIQHIEASCRKR
jgi:branched-subunit amino acid aminotransferase/4-amino-4-deoxychorismate lyase